MTFLSFILVQLDAHNCILKLITYMRRGNICFMLRCSAIMYYTYVYVVNSLAQLGIAHAYMVDAGKTAKRDSMVEDLPLQVWLGWFSALLNW